MKPQRRHQMPPLLNALGGAGKFIQLAAIEKIKGDTALKTAIAKENRKIKKNQKVIQVGTETFRFNTGTNLAGTGKERANAGMFDIFENMSPESFQRAVKTGSDDEKQNLFSFLTMRHLDWNNANEIKTADDNQIAPTTHAYKDIYSVYKNRLVPYGLAYARKIVNPSYSNAVNDWVAKHPELKGTFVIDKVQRSDAINYDFAPSALAKSEYVTDLQKISKKLNIPLQEAVRMFKIKDVDGADEAHLFPYKLYRKMQQNVGVVTDAKQFTGENELLKLRREAIQNGMSTTQFMNLLQTLSPDMAAKTSPGYIFVDKTKQRQASNKYMKEYHNIDTLARGQAASGALAAGVTAKNFKNTIVEAGAGGNLLAGGVAKLMEAVASDTGPIAGVKQVFKNFFEDDRFRIQGPDGSIIRNSLSNKFLKRQYENAQKLANADAGLFGGSVTIGGVEYANAKIAKFAGYVEFMKFQLAYQMASALQGGTGGRTISDQDVENMLRSMNFTGKSSVEHIASSLERISNIMGELHLVNSFYADSPQKAHAALLYEKTNLAGGSAYADYVANKVSQATKVGNPEYRPVGVTPVFIDGVLTFK